MITHSPSVIRPASLRDARLLAQLRFEFRASFGSVEEAEAPFMSRCERWIADRLGSGKSWQAWIAEADGVTVGNIWLQWIEKIPNPVAELEWHAYITSLYVREQFRGRQEGSSLLRTALDACRDRGVDAVILWPTPRSRSLYQRHGFVVRDDLMQLR